MGLTDRRGADDGAEQLEVERGERGEREEEREEQREEERDQNMIHMARTP